MLVMARWIIFQLAMTLLLISPSAAQACSITVSEPYIQLAFPTAKVGALYLQIDNPCAAADQLIGMRSQASAMVEMHQTVANEKGVMSMTTIEEGAPIPPFGTLTLVPGGLHFMLMGLELPTDNDDVEVILDFAKANDMVLLVPVRLKLQ